MKQNNFSSFLPDVYVIAFYFFYFHEINTENDFRHLLKNN